jgi:hypothetical protein
MRKWLFGIVATAVAAAMVTEVAARPRAHKAIFNKKSCAEMLTRGLRGLPADRSLRFQGKVDQSTARCRGGEPAVALTGTPWVDWANYRAAGGAESKDTGVHLFRNRLGIDGALLDLEYQRMELINFNLFDNNLTFEQYLTGSGGSTMDTWKAMRLPADHPHFGDVDVQADGTQRCKGQLIRYRTLTGICNDIRNPAMGSTGQLFARNVEFESTFPDLGLNDLAKRRHGDRISLFKPDPQVISRKLFTRDQSATPNCNQGHGSPDANDSDCSYKKAPFFNVLAAFWIQFMTHDWFSHLEEARNDQSHVMTDLGCATERVANVEQPLSPEQAAQLGCRKDDKMEAALIADSSPTGSFAHHGPNPLEPPERLQRAYKTTRNNVTAWWDASQIYGYDERSRQRVRRDPVDSAKLATIPAGAGDPRGYLPEFRSSCEPGVSAGPCDPIQPEWIGQEAAAFPDSWSIGLSFFHNLFVREHNTIVEEFRKRAKEHPDDGSGLRDPDRPSQEIKYGQISDDELFEIARLIVAAEIAKIHTVEWTTQLLYDEPLHIAMNANWSGLLADHPLAKRVARIVVERLGKSSNAIAGNELYSASAALSGIVGLDSTHHFGSPFNFPEEFVSVYRLHPLVPDMIEFRDIRDPNAIRNRIPVIDTFRGKATAKMREGGLANWALSMGRQRLGLLALRNHPQFLQNLDLRPRLDSKIDLAALDIIRDRERGIPRFNEFRRQLGLRQLTSFDDFIDRHLRLPQDSAKLAEQRDLVKTLREVYGQHRCNVSSGPITSAQLDLQNRPINDCLGHADGSMVDNIEDLDLVVGFLAETTRPHGFAISETQFQLFILNASRRLFSDRFFTSDFRPAFYTRLGIDWVNNNGPGDKQWEEGEPNGHKQEVLPLKRVLLRAMPELAPELKGVVNAFDPWARSRGQYYSLDWQPRPDAFGDEAFRN